MKARTENHDERAAGLPLTQSYYRHLAEIRRSQAANPECRNRYQESAARNPARPGPALSFSGNEADPLFHNTGKGFEELGACLGINRTEDGRGFVLTDLDGDGFLDVVLHNYFRNPLVALVNTPREPHRWIRLRLRGVASNRFGIGARATVNGRLQQLSCGSGYLSCSPPELHFGMGKEESAAVIVTWPSGRIDRYEALAPGRIHTLTEGRPEARVEAEPVRDRLDLPAPTAPAAPPDLRPALDELVTPSGSPATLDARRTLAVFYTPNCQTCVEDFERLADWERIARERKQRLVWICTDADPSVAEGRLRRLAPDAEVLRLRRPAAGMATPTVLLRDGDRVETFTGRWALEAAFEEAGR